MQSEAKIGAILCVRDREAAKRFYLDTLGLPLLHEAPYALVFNAGGTCSA